MGEVGYVLLNVSGKNNCIRPLCQVTLPANSCSTYKSKIKYALCGIHFVDNGITRFWSYSTSLNAFKVKGLQMTLPQTLPLDISMFKLMRV